MKTPASLITRVGLIALLFAASRGLAAGDTLVSGTISTSTTWTLANSPYVVTGDVYVENSVAPVLTIQAGVTVKFNAGTSLYIGNTNPGSLQAVGTSGSPITFTANASTTPGFWRSIRLRPGTTATSQIAYATVSYGGLANNWGAIHIESCSPTISNVTVSNNTYSGISISGGSPSISSSTISNNPIGILTWGLGTPSLQTLTISNNTGFAISQDCNQTMAAVSGLTLTGNGTNGIELRAGSAAVNTTWKSTGFPYVLTGDVFVEKNVAPVPVLTIQAGATVKLNANVSLWIGHNYPGELQAVGTSTSPIVFTANGSTTPGFWRSIRLRPNTTSTTQIAYATVSYGGLVNNWGALFIESCSPTISNVTVSNNTNAGLEISGGAAVVNGLTATGNQWGISVVGAATASLSSVTVSSSTAGGMYLAAPATLSLTTASITNNTGYAMSQDAGVTFTAASGITASGNTTNGVEVRGSTSSANATWKSFELPYVLTGDVFVEKNVAPVPVLTIQAGATVKFNAGVSLWIGHNYPAELQAVGTSTSLITFTANGSTTPGFWRSIRLRPNTTSTTQIAYATVSYGGLVNNWGALFIESCSPTISNVTVSNNTNAGLEISGGAAVVNGLTATGNQWGLSVVGAATASLSSVTVSSSTAGGMWLSAPATPSLTTASFTNNTGYAMSQDAGVTFTAATGVTASGNTTNGVEVRASSTAANAAWKSFGLPYVLSGDVYVEKSGGPAAVLTIQAGATVKFNAGMSLWIGHNYPGELQAVGTSASPITFTANGSTTPGYWRSIRLRPNTTSTTQIAYATVSYGGLVNNWGALFIESCSPTISNVTVSSNSNAGISVTGGAPVITGITATGNQWGLGVTGASTASLSSLTVNSNTVGGIYLAAPATPSLMTASITNNTGYAMSQDAGVTFTAATGVTASGNTTNGVEVRASSTAVNATWKSLGLPYVLSGDVYVEKSGGPAAMLTIQAGAMVKFNANVSLWIGNSYPGSLQAVGTSTSPITFTANGSTSPGFWRSIRLRPSATATQISYATVSYGGLVNNWGALFIESSSPTISNVTVSNNAESGIRVNGGSPTISNSTVTANGWGMVLYGTGSPSVTATTVSSNAYGGIYLAAPVTPSLTTVTLTNNTGYAMSQDAGVTITAASGLTATGNTTNGLEVRASSTAVNATWKSLGLPYVLSGDVYVEKSGGPAAVLTIQAGATVKFNANVSLWIGNSYPGSLQAVGTSTSPVTFTANGSTTPGFWRNIRLRPNATGTQISYATVSYGGFPNNYGVIFIESSSPTISNVTVSNNAESGIRVNGGSPTISNSTITANGWGIVLYGTGSPSVTSTTVSSNVYGGIYFAAPTAPSLTTVTLTSNTGYAMSQDAALTFGTVTGVTASGNTTNGIEVRASSTAVNATWKSIGLPYVVSGDVYVEKSGGPAAVLTIQAGASVQFRQNVSLWIGNSYPGSLLAIGTSTLPITFTAYGSTTPGYWRNIRLRPNATATQIAYATVSYGGFTNNYGVVFIESSSPTLFNVTLSNNAYAGISVNGGSPAILNSSFIGNTAGLINASPANVITANLNYWNAASGPSGAGSGTGQSVSAGVKFEPWLIAAPSSPNYFNSASQKNRAFNPAIGINTTITAGTVLSGNWTTTFLNSGGATVRTVTGSGLTESVVWNGKNDSGVDQPDGTYSYRLAATATTGEIATVAQGVAIMDRTKQLTVSNLAVNPAFFSPNGDGVQDTTTLTGTTDFDDTTMTVNVKTSGGTIVRTSSSQGLTLSYVWDGKNASAVVQPDGVYTMEVVATDGTAQATSSTTVTLDNTAPAIAISAPTDGQTLSNVYTNGVTDVAVNGSATDTYLNNWSVDYGAGSSPGSYTALGSGTSPVINATFATWHTAPPFANGLYTLRLQAWDKAGNHSTLYIRPTVGNFSASENALQLSAVAGNTVTYSSIVPFTLTETVTVKNSAGSVVRTLVNAVARTANTYNDVWNGKNDSAAFLPDGPYFYFATVSDGTHTFTWDQTNQYYNDYNSYNDGLNIQAWDPFNNHPLTFSYNFSQPSRVNIGLTPHCGGALGGCTPPNFCLAQDKWEEAGPHTVTWAGVDATGALRLDICTIGIVTNRTFFSKNAVVLFGTKPSVTNVTVTPAMYGPAVGTQTVAFDLASPQSLASTVTVTFLNQGSLSVLRTVTLTGQTPGHKTVVWDGHGDNGMWVAPGFYTVTVTATDPLGNQVQGQILTTIQY